MMRLPAWDQPGPPLTGCVTLVCCLIHWGLRFLAGEAEASKGDALGDLFGSRVLSLIL